MRNASPAFLTALNDARTKGIAPRRLLWVAGKRRDTGAPAPLGVWTGDEDLTFSVRDGQTGETVQRVYYGLGAALIIPSIPRVSDMTIQTLAIKLPHLHPVINSMIREHQPRFAKVDIHEVLLSTESRLLVGNPEIAFLGEVDGDPVETGAVGQEGSVTLNVASDAIRSLTRINHAKRSHAHQSQFNGDTFSMHTSAVANWDINWGIA